MRFAVGLGKQKPKARLEQRGVTRRQFLTFCSAVAVAMGIGPSYAAEVAKVLSGKRRPSVVYLHNAECTGCTESLLRSSGDFPIDVLLFDTISLDYHETLMDVSGDAAESVLHNAINNKDGFICIIEGAIPTAQNGIFGKIAGKTIIEINKEVIESPNCKLIIPYGTCAAFGGVQAAKPNPTGSKGIMDVFPDLKDKIVNISGCPPNPINLIGTLVAYLKDGKIPELDSSSLRPNLFFGTAVHELCERNKHFEAGEFAPSFDSEEARKGWCLYNLGCKGPVTFNNCPKVKFNQVNWPVGAGHPCLGCSEPDFWDEMSPFYES